MASKADAEGGVGRRADAGTPRVHELKTWPEFFAPLFDGSKTFEVRRADRDFRVGDTLLLREWAPMPVPCDQPEHGNDCRATGAGYTGRQATRTITYRMDGPRFGIEADHCILGLSSRSEAIPEAPNG